MHFYISLDRPLIFLFKHTYNFKPERKSAQHIWLVNVVHPSTYHNYKWLFGRVVSNICI